MKYQLAYNSWGKEELNAINKVIKSNRFTMGPYVKKFEKKFSKFLGSKYSVMVNSGSSANLLAAAILKYKNIKEKRNEIIVPGVSWSTTYNPFINFGYKLVFVDIDPNTFNIDINLLKKSITKKTLAVVPVSILGNPAELNEIKKICKKHKIFMIEDNCESMGAKINKKLAGSFGDLSTHSFFFSHHMSTMEGGMISTNSKEYYEMALALRAHGWTRDLPKNSKIYKKKNNDFYEAYKFILPGFNLRPLELSGSIGLEQLKKIHKFINLRKKNLKYFQSLFKNSEKFIIQKINGTSSSFCFPMILKPKYKKLRKSLLNKMKQNNIEYRIITGGCFTRHDVMKKFKYKIKSKNNKKLLNSEYLHDYGFFVGNAPRDLTKELELLYRVIS